MDAMYRKNFRPLDGESISKQNNDERNQIIMCHFRPLDGESISKQRRYL